MPVRMRARLTGIVLVFAFLWSTESLQAQELVVTLLGTGSPTPAIDRFGPSILVQAGTQTLVFDVGRGAHQRLSQAGATAGQVDAVFLTPSVDGSNPAINRHFKSRHF